MMRCGSSYRGKNRYTRSDLVDMAKKAQIKGYSKMNMDELCHILGIKNGEKIEKKYSPSRPKTKMAPDMYAVILVTNNMTSPLENVNMVYVQAGNEKNAFRQVLARHIEDRVIGSILLEMINMSHQDESINDKIKRLVRIYNADDIGEYDDGDDPLVEFINKHADDLLKIFLAFNGLAFVRIDNVNKNLIN